MKFCLSHKKYLLAGIYIICVIFTCFNARFYHTPLAKICSVSEMETMSREGTRGAEEHYYTQKITARILNGAYKGKEITLSNEYTSSQVQTQKYHKGDTVLLNGSKDRPGKTIRSVKRDIYLVVLVGGLIILLIYITRKQGGYTIVSVILNKLIFAYGFQLLGDGKNILRICNVIALLFSLTTLICLNGIHRKTWAAVLSTLCVLFLIMMLFDFSIHRYGDLDYSNLEYVHIINGYVISRLSLPGIIVWFVGTQPFLKHIARHQLRGTFNLIIWATMIGIRCRSPNECFEIHCYDLTA